MDTLFEGLFYFAMIAGVFALLGLIEAGIERFADAFDSWADSICTHYLDDL